MYTTYTYVCVHRQTHIQADQHTGRMDTQKGKKDKQTHLFSHLCATPTHDICSRASLSGAMPEVPTGGLALLWGSSGPSHLLAPHRCLAPAPRSMQRPLRE